MSKGDLDDEFDREELKDKQGRRRARERKEVFSLVERGAILLMSVGYFVYALIAHPYLPPIPALGGILALLARRRP